MSFQYILEISQAIPKINEASTVEEKKVLFDKYFDKNNLTDYEIVQMITGDNDGFDKNCQWTTYDGIRWYANEYDKDMSFGGYFTGMFTSSAPTVGSWMGNKNNTPIGLVISLYKDEIIAQWKKLYGSIISTDVIINLFNKWLNRIGTSNCEKEYNKWKEAPCIPCGFRGILCS